MWNCSSGLSWLQCRQRIIRTERNTLFNRLSNYGGTRLNYGQQRQVNFSPSLPYISPFRDHAELPFVLDFNTSVHLGWELTLTVEQVGLAQHRDGGGLVEERLRLDGPSWETGEVVDQGNSQISQVRNLYFDSTPVPMPEQIHPNGALMTKLSIFRK